MILLCWAAYSLLDSGFMWIFKCQKSATSPGSSHFNHVKCEDEVGNLDGYLSVRFEAFPDLLLVALIQTFGVSCFTGTVRTFARAHARKSEPLRSCILIEFPQSAGCAEPIWLIWITKLPLFIDFSMGGRAGWGRMEGWRQQNYSSSINKRSQGKEGTGTN